MRRALFVGLGLSLFALGGGAVADPFSSKPPLIGGKDIYPYAMAFDSAGNRYFAGGAFLTTADFDPGKGVQSRTDWGQGGRVFVTKFDRTGKWLWTQVFGGTTAGGALGTAQAEAMVFANDTVFVAGSFDTNDAGFGGPGTISSHHDNANYGSGFVFALDAANGSPRTAFNGTGVQIFGSSGGGSAHAHAVAITGSKLYVGGMFNATSFGVGGTGTTNSNQNDGFVAELDANTGASVAVFSGDSIQTFGGNGHEEVRSLVVDGGFLYVGGTMGSTNFGIGGVGTVSSGAQYDNDAFVAAINGNTGAAIPAFGGDGIVTFGATGTSETGAALAESNGTLYLAGLANSTGAKIDGAGSAFSTIGGTDVFVMALAAGSGASVPTFAGGVQFFGSPSDDPTLIVGGIAATPQAVYVAGELGAANARIGTGNVVAQADAFVLALDPATGGGLASFSGEGVQTIEGAGAGGYGQVYGVTPTADGLALIGIVNGEGTLDTTRFPGSGAFFVLLDPQNGDPLNMGANQRPVHYAPPTATPNPVVAGKPTVLKAYATDPDKDKLTYLWQFGDQGTSTAKSPKKVYTTPGTYGVLCTARDGKGGSTDSAVLNVVVVSAGTPYFDVTKTTVALKFTTAGDTITVSGQFPLAAPLLGHVITLDVGGVAVGPLTLDAKGKSPKGNQSIAVSAPKNGVAKFTAKLAKGTYAASLADEGMTATKVANLYAPTVVTVTVDGVPYTETMPLFYTSKNGKTGAAK